MTPIIKNISVVDAQGRVYEATYPKRAKGLVKKGRARFVSDNMLCMIACPPVKMEDTNMNNIYKPVTQTDADEPVSNGPRPEAVESVSEQEALDYIDASMKQKDALRNAMPDSQRPMDAADEGQMPTDDFRTVFTPEWLKERIEFIMRDTGDITEAVHAIGNMEPCVQSQHAPPDTRAKGVADVIAAREETNRQMLAMFERMLWGQAGAANAGFPRSTFANDTSIIEAGRTKIANVFPGNMRRGLVYETSNPQHLKLSILIDGEFVSSENDLSDIRVKSCSYEGEFNDGWWINPADGGDWLSICINNYPHRTGAERWNAGGYYFDIPYGKHMMYISTRTGDVVSVPITVI